MKSKNNAESIRVIEEFRVRVMSCRGSDIYYEALTDILVDFLPVLIKNDLITYDQKRTLNILVGPINGTEFLKLR